MQRFQLQFLFTHHGVGSSKEVWYNQGKPCSALVATRRMAKEVLADIEVGAPAALACSGWRIVEEEVAKSATTLAF